MRSAAWQDIILSQIEQSILGRSEKYKNAISHTSVCQIFYKKFKRLELIMKDVTALISEQFPKSRLDYSSFAKLSKRDLHKLAPPLRNVRACVHA